VSCQSGVWKHANEQTTGTPFDIVVLDKISRFHLAIGVLRYVPRLRSTVSDVIDMFNRKLHEHHVYIREHLEDMPEIKNWHWTKDFAVPGVPPPPAKAYPREQLFTDSSLLRPTRI
jgi:xylulose-5-phosphate/fructose-6-phosphate phosphoketolase